MNSAQPIFDFRSAATHESHGTVHLATRNLLRSINFFSMALGLEIVRDERRPGSRCVTMSARGCSDVVIHARQEGSGTQFGAATGVLIVTDLERVRARVWDAGALVTRHRGAPAQIHVSHDRRSLYVRDPDGHELELAEVW